MYMKLRGSLNIVCSSGWPMTVKTRPGSTNRIEAKMIGITPAMLTLIGR